MNKTIKPRLWFIITATMITAVLAIFAQFQDNLQFNQEKVFEKIYSKNFLVYARDIMVKTDKTDINHLVLYNNYRQYLNNIDDAIKSRFIFRGPDTKKQVVLTFDDGPANNTQRIIKVLKKYNTPATFFLTCGRINEKNIKLYDSDLFSVGFHTYSHKNYDRFSKLEISEDIDKCINIFNKNNLFTRYFRPAFGIINERIEEVLEKNNLQGVIWSLDSHDWKDYRNEKLVNHVINNLNNGSIILFHDTIISPNDLSDIIIGIKKKGFDIVHLEELLGK